MNITHTLAISSIVLVFGWPVSRVLAADAQAGKVVYDKSCAGCHGSDGKGNPAMAKVLGDKGLNIVSKDTTQQSDEQLLKVIAEGLVKCPHQNSAKQSKSKCWITPDLWRSKSQGPPVGADKRTLPRLLRRRLFLSSFAACRRGSCANEKLL